MELADEVCHLHQVGQPTVPRGVELAARLPQLRRDPLVAQEPVELLLGGEPTGHLARLDHRHPVLENPEASSLRILAERDVVVLRPREVLEQAAEVLGWHDTEVDTDALLVTTVAFVSPCAAISSTQESRRSAR